MNSSTEFALGEVRQPNDRGDVVYRVFSKDAHEVFHDALSSLTQSWTFGSSRRKCYYYRDYADRFFNESAHVRYQPLTQEERDLFRPDLPMSLLRSMAVSWGFTGDVSRYDCEQRVRAAGLDLDCMPGLALARVVLIATPLQASSRGVICDAENGKSFSSGELLWHANRVQSQRGRMRKPGIGLFRMGHQNGGIPSFVVGGANEHPTAGPAVS